MRGVIALDIDGTITSHHTQLKNEVKSFLKLISEEWSIVFITGRSFTWGWEILQDLDFSYYLGVHNGAILYRMPSKQIVIKKLLPVSSLSSIDLLFKGMMNDYILYPETEGPTTCFFRPTRFSFQMLEYLKCRSETFQEKWIPFKDLEELPFDDFFALKYFGSLESVEVLAMRLENQQLHAPIIKDPYDLNVYIIQATHYDVSKGSTFMYLKELLHPDGTTIAAGDDNNDASMLALADIKVVMATAPESLLKMAHVIAPPATEMGIISGLTNAINWTVKR